jgi:phage terminase small subunit
MTARKPPVKKLTPKQQNFALEYLDCGNASEAYRRAYDCKRMSQKTIGRNAQALLKNNIIAAYIAEKQNAAAEKARLSKSWVLERLMRNARICMGEETIKLKVYSKTAGEVIDVDAHDRDSTAANRALELLGKEMKMFVDRQELSGQLDIAELVPGLHQKQAAPAPA